MSPCGAHTHTHTHTHTRTHTHTHTHAHTHTHTLTHACIHIHTHTCTQCMPHTHTYTPQHTQSQGVGPGPTYECVQFSILGRSPLLQHYLLSHHLMEEEAHSRPTISRIQVKELPPYPQLPVCVTIMCV